MNKTWSTYVQNPTFLKSSRIQIMNREVALDVVKKLNIQPGMKVLDVGTGTGEFIKYLSAHTNNVDYTGIDFDSVLIQAASKDSDFINDTDNSYTFIEADASNLPFEDHSFDVVVSHTFLTACWHYEQAMEEMRRVCKEDGMIGTINIADFDDITNCDGCIQDGMEDWYFDYRNYQIKYESARHKEFPITNYNLGALPNKLPQIFSQKGFKNVCVTPIGTFFSLSNPTTDKEAYINIATQAEIERVQSFIELSKSDAFTKEDANTYISYLEKRKNYVLQHLDDNAFWKSIAATYLLITAKPGISPVKQDSEYIKTKFKADRPAKTIEKIKGILASLGIETEEMDIASGIPNLYSCRVNIKGTMIGQNGKGTSPLFAKASGYAEFMERLATGYLFQCDLPKPYQQKDATMISYDEIDEKCGDMLSLSKKRIEGPLSIFMSNTDYMKKWDFATENGKFLSFPFERVTDKKTEYLPDCIYRNYYYTNGSCAGNTKEEALTQGISEIMERYVFMRLLKEDLTPPEISDEELKNIPTVWNIICQIRSYGNLKLKVFDASLGMGLPVVGAFMIDSTTKTVRFKLGAHPRIESAIERTLTEIFQGMSIKDVTKHNPKVSVLNTEYVHNDRNLFNMAKNGSGMISYKALLNTPSWKYTGFTSAPENPKGQYQYMLDLCEKLKWNVYVRDCSFYGFPVYHVIIPDISVLFDFGKTPYVSYKYRKQYKDTLLDLAHASEQDRTNALKTMSIMSGWVMQDSLDWNAGVPVNASFLEYTLSYTFVLLLINLEKKDYKQASQILRLYKGHENLDILSELVEARDKNLPEDEVIEFLNLVYDSNKVKEVLDVLNHPMNSLPSVKCYQCETCNRNKTCNIPKLLPIFNKMY